MPVTRGEVLMCKETVLTGMDCINLQTNQSGKVYKEYMQPYN